MKLVREMAVHTDDGRFGELADVVIDPFTHQVTHIVVDPGGDHQQLRLVPVWLVTEADEGLQISLPESHVRQLQRALDSDYVRAPAKLVTGAQLLRFKTVLALPHYHDESITKRPDTGDEVPIRSCEIRRSSWVVDRDTHVVGTVVGLLLRDDVVHSVVVRSGAPGHRQNVAVPLSSVESVGSHFVSLRLTSAAFKQLPITQALPAASVHFRPRELWREVLGLPTNKLWDDFEVDARTDPN